MTKDLKLGILGAKPPSSIKGMMSFIGSFVATPFLFCSSLGGVGSLGGEGDKMDLLYHSICLCVVSPTTTAHQSANDAKTGSERDPDHDESNNDYEHGDEINKSNSDEESVESDNDESDKDTDK
ncbi:hypothetical protein Tco_0546790 [Tanacetum coccineum]